MRRRIAPLFLAALIALPVVLPVNAAEPTASPATEPSLAPDPATPPPASADPGATPAFAEPSAAPSVEPAPYPDPAPATDAAGRPDTTGRYIVMLKNGTNTASVVDRVRKRDGVHADQSYARTFRGFAAKLDAKQRRDIGADPNVIAVVPDEVIELTQTVPTGVSRVGVGQSDIASIDGVDERVDADVAIVDTGIAQHPDLNVAGGYNCSTSDHSAWRDKENHGTHVAGIVGALDNSFGVVGVAPGVRLWAVKILNDDGYGLLSWYVCGLDWILTQRDPNDASRPLFEAVNMSVTKAGSDDNDCGLTNHDVLHQAVCRVVAGGITVVAAAANDSHNAAANIPASYNEVITVSALADTDGLPGGLGGNKCFSWGTYDKDDTFANFSNFGSDVDLIAPGKCILSTVPGPGYAYMSGTSMAAPTVTGAVALYKASRPNATPTEVREGLRYLGNFGWRTSTDPDPYHEPLLDVSRLGTLGTFGLTAPSKIATVEGGSTGYAAVGIDRSSTFFERVTLRVTAVPDGWTGIDNTGSAMGWDADTGLVPIGVPKDTPKGRYHISVEGTNQGRTDTATVSVDVVEDDPTAMAPVGNVAVGDRVGSTTAPIHVSWPAATDPSSPIGGYEVQLSRAGGAFGTSLAKTAAQRSATYTMTYNVPYVSRLRAKDVPGHWSPWVSTAAPIRVIHTNDRSRSVVYHGKWTKTSYRYATAGTMTGSSKKGASAKLAFNGHGIALVAPRNKWRGKADIYIDGVLVKHLNLATKTGVSRQIVYARWFAAGGTHRIEVRVVRGAVQIDGFLIVR